MQHLETQSQTRTQQQQQQNTDIPKKVSYGSIPNKTVYILLLHLQKNKGSSFDEIEWLLRIHTKYIDGQSKMQRV